MCTRMMSIVWRHFIIHVASVATNWDVYQYYLPDILHNLSVLFSGLDE